MPMDTAEYLTSQGWKGKGTALKHGHVTRPLAVVQKKTLGGVGKDRDEAVPFWDNIFAAAAINIKVSSEAPTPVTSGTATPVEVESPAPSKPSSMNAFARGKKEMARRLLYSKFFRGDVLVSEDLDKIPGASSSSARTTSNGMEAGSSRLLAVQAVSTSLPTSRSNTAKPDPNAEESVDTASGSSSKESAEEKALRKAERAAKKAAKVEAKAAKVLKKEAKAKKRAEKAERGSVAAEGKEERRKGKDKKKQSEAVLSQVDGEDVKEKKRKRSPVDEVQVVGGSSAGQVTETSSPRKKKKKRQSAE